MLETKRDTRTSVRIMSSGEDDAYLLLALLSKRKRKRNRRYWVHPYSTANLHRSIFKSCTSEEIMDDPVKFQSFYRMSQGTFTILLDRLEPFIKKVDTKFREAISPKEKLIMTLR